MPRWSSEMSSCIIARCPSFALCATLLYLCANVRSQASRALQLNHQWASPRCLHCTQSCQCQGCACQCLLMSALRLPTVKSADASRTQKRLRRAAYASPCFIIKPNCQQTFGFPKHCSYVSGTALVSAYFASTHWGGMFVPHNKE